MTNSTSLQQTRQALLDLMGEKIPEVGIILGSGLASFGEAMEIEKSIPYADIPGFPQPSVSGHSGSLLIGELNGRRLACLQGRVHSYEQQQPEFMIQPIRALKMIGMKSLLITSAVGSLREDMPAGSLMMLTDHINMSGVSPLAGPNDEAIGPRFPDLSRAYDVQLQEVLKAAAARQNIDLHEGVFLMVRGPHFETPAEIRAFQRLGADVVGMSMVPEVILANHCGIRVAAVSLVTNLGAGMTDSTLTHDETLAEGEKAAANLAKLVAQALPDF